MFIIDLRNKLVSDNHFSVINNNDVDEVWFFSHFIQYASYNVYLKVISEDKTYIDKIKVDSSDISIEDNALVVKWVMKSKATRNKKLSVQLLFENPNGEEIAQDRIITITLGSSLEVDKEIEEHYPSILTSLQRQIDELKRQVEGDN